MAAGIDMLRNMINSFIRMRELHTIWQAIKHPQRAIDTAMRAAFGLAIYRPQIWLLRMAAAAYIVGVALLMWVAAGMPSSCVSALADCSWSETRNALIELTRAFGAIFLEVVIVVLIGIIALWLYRSGFNGADEFSVAERYKKEYPRSDEDRDISIAFAPSSEVEALLKQDHFAFSPALTCTIDASALNSTVLFQSTQGGFDVAKLRLIGVRKSGNTIALDLGSAAFRDHNLAHTWAFVPLANESTNETDKRLPCLYGLLSQSQREVAYEIQRVVSENGRTRLRSFAPNALGVSVFLRGWSGSDAVWLMRLRSNEVSGDRNIYCAAVAGLIDVFPEFASRRSATALDLIRQEYNDEVCELIREEYKVAFGSDRLELRPLGLVFTYESNYQPELYFLADIRLPSGSHSNWLGQGDLHIVENLRTARSPIRARDVAALKAFCPDAL